MSELTAQIKAVHDIVREALDQHLSLEGDADLAEVLEVLRSVVRQDHASNGPEVAAPVRAAAARPRRRRSTGARDERP